MAEDDPTGGGDTHKTQVTQQQYEPDGRAELTTAIVYAIAEAEGVSPSDMTSPPLYNAMDVPAIEDAFFGPAGGGEARRGTGAVEFRYAGYLVKVRSDGWIQIHELPDTDRP